MIRAERTELMEIAHSADEAEFRHSCGELAIKFAVLQKLYRAMKSQRAHRATEKAK